MTVCVAAICENNILFGASDRMLTSGDVEFEPRTQKIYQVTNSISVMIAGDAGLQSEILQALYAYAGARITAAPNEWIPVSDIASEYYRFYQSIRSRRAEARLLVPLGLTLDSFRSQQRSLLDSTANELTSSIVNFDMPGIEAIISGCDMRGAHIYIANNAGVQCQDAIGFAAIGIGSWHANSQFMFARHDRGKPLPETLLLTYAAKKRAEVAPGVGSGTDMFTLGPALGTFTIIKENILKDVDKIYKRTRSRSAKSIERSNVEVTQYVEDLGKAAAPEQQQPSATPKPGDKSNGKEAGTDGKAHAGTQAKPN